MTDHELQLKVIRLRKLTLEAIVGAGAGHTGDKTFLTANYAKYTKGENGFRFALFAYFA